MSVNLHGVTRSACSAREIGASSTRRCLAHGASARAKSEHKVCAHTAARLHKKRAAGTQASGLGVRATGRPRHPTISLKKIVTQSRDSGATCHTCDR